MSIRDPARAKAYRRMPLCPMDEHQADIGTEALISQRDQQPIGVNELVPGSIQQVKTAREDQFPEHRFSL